jgi:hypothetical protein
MRAWTPGAQVLDSNDDMDEDKEIPFEIPDEFQLAQASQDESVQSVFDVKKDNAAADAFLGCKILYNWSAVVWIEGELLKRKKEA